MKTFLSSISNKLKAIYVVWVFINVILIIFGLSSSSAYYKISQFFPFYWAHGIFVQGSWRPDVAYYDFTEFVVYVFTPLILAYAIWLFRKK